jgi:hypothetical protein
MSRIRKSSLTSNCVRRAGPGVAVRGAADASSEAER